MRDRIGVAKTLAVISAESRVVVSSLARLEMLSQIHGGVAGGLFSASRAGRLLQRVEVALRMAPYEPARCPADIIESFLVDQTCQPGDDALTVVAGRGSPALQGSPLLAPDLGPYPHTLHNA